MGRHDVPEEDVLGQPELGEHAVDDGRGSLARRRARELALGGERDAAHARAAVAGGLADEEHPRVASGVEVAGQSRRSVSPRRRRRGRSCRWPRSGPPRGHARSPRLLTGPRSLPPRAPHHVPALRRRIPGARSAGRCSWPLIPNVAARARRRRSRRSPRRSPRTWFRSPLLQLVSGTLAERLGPRRVVRGAYIGFGVAAARAAPSRPTSGRSWQPAPRWARPTPSSPPSCSRRSPRSRRPACSGGRWGRSRPPRPPGSCSRPSSAGCSARSRGGSPSSSSPLSRSCLALPRQSLEPPSGSRGRTGAPRSARSSTAGSRSWPTQAALGYLGLHGDRLRARPRRRRGVRPRLRRPRPAHRRLRRRRDPARALRRQRRRPRRPPGDGARRNDRLHRRRPRPRLRTERLEPRARFLRRRLCLDVRLGGTEHDRGRVVPREPGRRDLRLQRVQVRRRRDRAARSTCRSSTSTRACRSCSPPASRRCSPCSILPWFSRYDETPRRRPRPRPGRLLSRHDAAARAGSSASPAGCATPGKEPSRRSSRARRRRSSGSSTSSTAAREAPRVERVEVFDEDDEGLTRLLGPLGAREPRAPRQA